MPVTIDEERVRARIEYARSLHATARGNWDTLKTLLTREYEVPKEVEDLGITIFKPAKPQAIVGKALSILSSRAKETIEVVPMTGVGKEQELCTRLEKYAGGVMKRSTEGRRLSPYLEWVLWYLCYGKGCLEWRFFPQYMDTRVFPIRALAPQAPAVSEVVGDAGVLYYAKEYQRMKLDLQTELASLKGAGKAWAMPGLESQKDTDYVTVQEYWDDTYKALLVEGELVWLNPHKYGFCPLVVVYCEPLPLDEPEWWGQGILGPISEALKQQAILLSKLLTGVELHFWPQLLAQNPNGTAQVIQATPGMIQEVDPQAKVQPLAQNVNAPLLEQLNSWIEGDINLMTGLTDLSFGNEPPAGTSGYLVAQVLGQILDRFQQKLDDIGQAKAQHIQQLFTLTGAVLGKEWGDVTGGKGFSIDVRPDEGQRRRGMVTVSPEDVADERQVYVTIKPTIPQELLMKAELAGRLRTPGPDGRPLVDDKTIREEFLSLESPDLVEERILEQGFLALPEVQEVLKAEYLEKFRKEHGLDKGMPKLTQGQVQQLMETLAQMMSGQSPMGQPVMGQEPMPFGQPGQGPPPGLPPEMGGGVGPGQPPVRPEDVFLQQMAGQPPGY